MTTDPTFTNLADLANYRLKNASLHNGSTPSIAVPIANKIGGNNFVIPKFKSGQSPNYGSSSEGLTPHEMSLKKIMEMRKLHISDDAINTTDTNSSDVRTITFNSRQSSLSDSTNFVVDLSAALLGKEDQVIVPPKIIPEVFNVKFVDCEISPRIALMPIITKDCEIDASSILNQQVGIRTRRTSSFGKIICTNFRRKHMPYVSHEFQPVHKIVPFAFNTVPIIRKMNVKKNEF